MRPHPSLALFATLALLAAAPLGAQRMGTTHIGLSAGAAFPSDDFTDDADPGYQLGVHYQASLGRGLGLRLGVDASRLAFPDAIKGHWLLVGAMAQVVVPIRVSSTVKPYMLGGVGATRLTVAADGVPDVSDTKLALGVGLGYDFRLIGTTWFTEARFLSVETPKADGHQLHYIPVVIGFRF